MKWFLFLSFSSFFAVTGHAEAPAQPQGQGAASGYRNANPNVISPFDSDFFNKIQLAPPPAAPADKDPSGRSYGDPVNYNTDTRANALKACEKWREKDSKRYKSCYDGEIQKSVKAVQDGYEAQEKKFEKPREMSEGDLWEKNSPSANGDFPENN